jgi:hypothetical protein
MSFPLAALLAALVTVPLLVRAADPDPKKQSPKPLVTSEAKIPKEERYPAAKPVISGKFSSVTVTKTTDHGHVTAVTMNIPWSEDPAKRVELQIGEPNSKGDPVVTKYRVLQVHMHRHGEHTMDGNEYQLEMHCVLADPVADGPSGPPPGKAVLAFLLVQGTEDNAGLKFYFDNLGKDGNVDFAAQDMNLLLPHDKTYFVYNGSLTTPHLDNELNPTPILWYVVRNEIHMSNDQYKKYVDAVAEHFRIPQTGNDSVVWLIIPQPLGEK